MKYDTNIKQSLYSSAGVVQVNIPAATGDMGVLANHVASIEPLRPGVVEVIEENGQQSKKWFGMSPQLLTLGNMTDRDSLGRFRYCSRKQLFDHQRC